MDLNFLMPRRHLTHSLSEMYLLSHVIYERDYLIRLNRHLNGCNRASRRRSLTSLLLSRPPIITQITDICRCSTSPLNCRNASKPINHIYFTALFTAHGNLSSLSAFDTDTIAPGRSGTPAAKSLVADVGRDDTAASQRVIKTDISLSSCYI